MPLKNIVKITRWDGRLGNNLCQLAFAIFMAKSKSYRLTYPSHKIIKQIQFDFTKNNVTSQPQTTHNELSGNFYFCPAPNLYRPYNTKSFQYNIDDYDQRMVHQIFINHISKTILNSNPKKSLSKSLVIHLRGGDIFSSPKPHTSYVQPPFAFYQCIIDGYINTDFNVLLVTEDRKNPCLNEIVSYCKNIGLESTIQTSSQLQDLSTLAHSEHLVLSNSTFSYVGLMMNQNCKIVHIPVLKFDEIGEYRKDTYHCKSKHYLIKNYIPLGKWNSSSNTKKNMIEYSKNNIELIE